MFERLFKKHLNPWRIRQMFILIAGLNLTAGFIVLPLAAFFMVLFGNAAFATSMFNMIFNVVSAVAFGFMLILAADYISPIWPRDENEEEDKND